eukprot:6936459-Prymnesium_polylepis.1
MPSAASYSENLESTKPRGSRKVGDRRDSPNALMRQRLRVQELLVEHARTVVSGERQVIVGGHVIDRIGHVRVLAQKVVDVFAGVVIQWLAALVVVNEAIRERYLNGCRRCVELCPT